MSYTFDEAKKLLKGKLVEYLESKDIRPAKTSNRGLMYHCFNPDHDDKTPSMSVVELEDGTQVYHCFGACQASGDIFAAKHLIEKTASVGYEFIEETFKPLCDQFNIDYKQRPLTQDEIEEMNIKTIFGMIKNISHMNLINGKVKDCVEKYKEERRITRDDIVNFSLGYIPNYDNFIIQMGSMGVEKSYLEQIGVNRALFNSNNLIFSVFNEHGVIRGFAGRNCVYRKEDGGSKYINSTQNSVYNKKEILYNLHRARKKKVAKHGSLYITEGYTDAIAMDKAGLKAVALGGVYFTENHISVLQRLGINDIVFVLDSDEAGNRGTGKAITEVMEGIRNFRVRMVSLPEGEDPDSFVRKYGADSIHDLEHVSAFQWRLRDLKKRTDLDGSELAKQMVPLIVNERSIIERDKMCKEVSRLCEISADVIRKEVQAISDNEKIKIRTEVDAIIDNTVKMLRKSPEDASIIFTGALRSVKDVSERHSANMYGNDECIDDLESFNFSTDDETNDSFTLKEWNIFSSKLDGSMQGKLLFIGGQPNAGKSSFLMNWIYQILSSGVDLEQPSVCQNEDLFNNVCIIHHTIDDARVEAYPRYYSLLGNNVFNRCEINYMAKTHKFKGDMSKLMNAKNYAHRIMLDWIKNGRLVVKDTSHGSSLSAAEQIIETMVEKFPDRKIIYVCDNFHNLSDLESMDDENVRMKILANRIKDIAVINRATCIATVEYNKGKELNSRQALNEMIKSSKSLEYKANFIMHLLNEMHTDPENTEMYHFDDSVPMDERTDIDRIPVIKGVVSKNKITGFKGNINWKFYPSKALFKEVTPADIDDFIGKAKVQISRDLGLNQIMKLKPEPHYN